MLVFTNSIFYVGLEATYKMLEKILYTVFNTVIPLQLFRSNWSPFL